MFGATNNRGFHITFANGWTVSVQWGFGNYCHNRQLGRMENGQEQQSLTAEIAAWPNAPEGAKPCEDWYSFGEYRDEDTGELYGQEHVKGWCKPDAVLAFMNEIANKPKE